MSDTTDKPTRPKRQRTRRNGRYELVKRPDSAKNAQPAKVFLWHGLGSSFLRGQRPDMRSAVGRAVAGRQAAYIAHLGGDPSVPQQRLTNHAARFGIVADALWARLNANPQTFEPDALAGMLDAFVRISREEREVLKLLGLERKARDIPTLQDYLRQKAAEKEAQQESPEPTDAP